MRSGTGGLIGPAGGKPALLCCDALLANVYVKNYFLIQRKFVFTFEISDNFHLERGGSSMVCMSISDSCLIEVTSIVATCNLSHLYCFNMFQLNSISATNTIGEPTLQV